MSNLETLQKRLEELKTKEIEFRKYAEYHHRQLTSPSVGERGYRKHKAKEEYWRMKQSNAGLETQQIEGQIAALKLEEQREEYRTRLTGFYRETIEYLISLKDALEKKDIPFAGQVVDDLEQVYLDANSLDKEDLKLISGYLSFQSTRIRLGRVEEEMGEEVKINATVGASIGAQKRTNIATWISNLVGQINSLIEMLEQRINGS
jgi:hypothetical protein